MVYKSTKRKSKNYKKRLVIFFFLFINFNIFSLDAQVLSIGQKFIVYKKVDELKVEDTDINFVNPTTSESEVSLSYDLDFSKDINGNITGINFAFTPRKAGYLHTPKISYSIKNKKYFLQALPLEVKDSNGVIPLKLEWKINKTRYYEGENILLNLVLKDLKKTVLPRSINTFEKLEGVYINKIDTFSRIKSYNFYGIKLNSIVLKSFVLTSSIAGEIIIPSASVSLEKQVVNSKELKLQLKSLPKKIKNTSFAFGDFIVNLSYSQEEKMKLTDVMKLTLSIQGNGNLNILKAPKITVDNFLLTEENKKDSFSFLAANFSGYKEFNYKFSPKKEGSGKIKVEQFLYYSQLEQKIKIVSFKDKIIKINSFNASSEGKYKITDFKSIKNEYYFSILKKNVFLLLLIPVFFFIYHFSMPNFLKKVLFYTLILTSFSLTIYFNTKNIDKKFLQELQETLDSNKNNLELANSYLNLIEKNKELSNLFYNASIITYKANNLLLAKYLIRNAIEIKQDEKFIAFYSFLKNKKFIPNFEFKNKFFFSKELNRLFMIIFLDLFLISLIIYFKSKKEAIQNIFLLISFLLFLLSSILFLFFNRTIKFNALVKEDNPMLKKIPTFQSQGKNSLTSGDYLKVESENEKYYFLETINKTKGWLLKKQVYPLLSYFSYHDKDFKNLIKTLKYDLKQQEKKIPIPKEEKSIFENEKSKDAVSLDGSINIFPIPFSPDGDGFNDKLNISLSFDNSKKIKSWALKIFDSKGRLFKKFNTKEKEIPKSITWDGRADNGDLVESASDYKLVFTVLTPEGKTIKSTMKLPVDILIEKIKGRLFMRVSSITFPSGAADFKHLSTKQRKANKKTLDRIAYILSKFKLYNITIEGHANLINWQNEELAKKEQEEDLLPLSYNRAKTVMNYLISKNVDRNRLKAVGIGGLSPIVPFSDFENKWKNRRVEFILNKK